VLSWCFARPLWVVRVLPLDDLPNHLARITAYHYLDDPRWNLAAYYTRSLGLVPYLGHFYPVHLMTYLFGTVVRANLVYMTLYVFAAPLCGLAFARATGRSRWLAFLLLPLATGYFFQWGFISFCVGVMLMLPACALLYRVLDGDGWQWRRAIGLGLLTATIYLCHVAPWGALGLYAFLILIVELGVRRWRGPLLAAAAMLPSVALLAASWARAHRIGYVRHADKYDAVKDSAWTLLKRIAQCFNLWQKQDLDEWLQLGLVLLVILLIASDGGPQPNEPLRRKLRIPLALIAFLVMTAAAPFWITKPFNWWMVNLRFLMPAIAVAAFLPRGAIRGARAALLGVGLAASTLLPLYTARNYRDFAMRADPIIALLERVPLGSNTLFLHTPTPNGQRSFADPVMAPEMALWREIYNYPLVYRGGYDPYMYDDGFPIRRTHDLAAPKVESALVKVYSPEESRFKPERMLYGWDYFIVKNDYLDAMPPDGVVKVDTRGGFSLFHNLLKDQKPPPDPIYAPPPPAIEEREP